MIFSSRPGQPSSVTVTVSAAVSTSTSASASTSTSTLASSLASALASSLVSTQRQPQHQQRQHQQHPDASRSTLSVKSTQTHRSPSNTATLTTTKAAAPPAVTLSHRSKPAKHVGSSPGLALRFSLSTTPVTTAPSVSSDFDAAMANKPKDRRDASAGNLPPSSPPSTTTTSLTRPTSSSGPVQIPHKTKSSAQREAAHLGKRYATTHHRRRTVTPRDVHSPDSISPSMAALLAVTDIPRPRRTQSPRRGPERPLIVDEIVGGAHHPDSVDEKELSLSFSRSPMDLLLSPPGDLDDDGASISASASESNVGSAMTRTISADSVPSMGDSFVTDVVSSLETPDGQSPSTRRRRSSPTSKPIEPVRSSPDAIEEHPLVSQDLGLDGLDFNPLERPDDEAAKSQFMEPFKPLRSVFKSNLTASLRALRSAAKSFSGINFPSIPADDLLTRSLLTMDPKVPYTDERRPPATEEMPSAELRRYLNPTTNARETHPATPPPPGGKPTSIQMQTYKVHRSRSAPPSARIPMTTDSDSSPAPPATPTPASQAPARPANKTSASFPPGPGMRQREMRENSDFIRIAVMEMAMRKRGKLDGQRPGRARWALPPRKSSATHYEVGTNGVPARWASVSSGT